MTSMAEVAARDKLVIKDYLAGEKTTEIAKKYKIDITEIFFARKRNNVSARKTTKRIEQTKLRNGEIVKEYLVGELYEDLSKKYKIGLGQLYSIIGESGADRANYDNLIRQKKDGLSKEERDRLIIKEYLEGVPLADIGRKYHYDKTHITIILKRNNIERGRYKVDLMIRFWKNVNKTDTCWVWTADKNNSGYGRLKLHQKAIQAHRLSYEFHFGPIPKGLYVLHRCDNRLCVRPSCLWLGTNEENIADMVSKNRQAKGSKQGNSKLTEAQALEIKFSIEKNIVLAKRFNIDDSTVSAIKRNYSWKHLTKEMYNEYRANGSI